MSIRLVWDEEKRVINVGAFTVKCFNPVLQNRNSFVSAVCSANRVSVVYGSSLKESNKQVCDALGISTVTLHKHFVKLMRKKYIAEVIPFIKNRPYAFGKKRGEWFNLANANFKILETLGKDNLQHLGTICAITSSSPEDLKNRWGKAVWKKIHNASPSRVGIIANIILSSHMPADKDMMRAVVNTPSTVLLKNKRHLSNIEVMEWLTKNCKGHYKNSNELAITYNDYISMCSRLGELPEKVTAKNVGEKHDAMVLKINQQKDILYSAPFNFPTAVKPFLCGYVHEGYTANILKSKEEIDKEGRAMRHCVSMYGERAANQECLIVSLTKDGEKYSTVEYRRVSVAHGFRYSLGQHYMKCNRAVECPEARACAINLLLALNKECEDKAPKGVLI